jgi:TRAP-type mannitol/chloroaromatic compound transport system substrate-binding protein
MVFSFSVWKVPLYPFLQGTELVHRERDIASPPGTEETQYSIGADTDKKEAKMDRAYLDRRNEVQEGVDRAAFKSTHRFRFIATVFASVCTFLLAAQSTMALDISFRSFSKAAAIGPPADEYAAKLLSISKTALGESGQISFKKYSPTPAIPKEFNKSIVAAVAEGGPLAGGKGFDAAYVSGSSLNPAWGFIYNSGVPFGPNFDEFLGFLYGKSINLGTASGLDQLQQILDESGKNIIAIPIVGSSHQGSGYFMSPVGNVGSTAGIGLAGLCQKDWTFRYLPPAQYVLDRACENLVAAGKIPKKNIKFIKAIAGGGSLVKAVTDNKLQAFEFATPLDDVSSLFGLPEGNPGTVGTRYLHYPGWHQPFLITYMIINKNVWNKLSPAQQTLVLSVGRDHVISSYGENLRQQGAKLKEILTANDGDKNAGNDLVLVQWPQSDLALLRDATIQFLNTRVSDEKLSEQDRKDYSKILESLRTYVSSNYGYWKVREVSNDLRFQDWTDPEGKKSWD